MVMLDVGGADAYISGLDGTDYYIHVSMYPCALHAIQPGRFKINGDNGSQTLRRLLLI